MVPPPASAGHAKGSVGDPDSGVGPESGVDPDSTGGIVTKHPVPDTLPTATPAKRMRRAVRIVVLDTTGDRGKGHDDLSPWQLGLVLRYAPC
jgi:hypothetical protein